MNPSDEGGLTREQFDRLPPKLKEALLHSLYPTDIIGKGKPPAAGAPYTQLGAPGLKGESYMPAMESGTRAVTVSSPRDPARDSFVTYRPGGDTPLTRAHEMEHVLDNQGNPIGNNKMWDQLVLRDINSGTTGALRGEMVARLVEHAPYLQKKYGLPENDAQKGYFSSVVLQRPDMRNFLAEQLATLSGLEQIAGKRLTDDPYLRKNVFKTPAERETYNAMTGLRQTRTDARDLPSYTRQEEPNDPSSMGGMWDKGIRAVKGLF